MLDFAFAVLYIVGMKKHKQQMLPLTPEADAVLERRKAQTLVPKFRIAEKLILQAAKRWWPQEVIPQQEEK